MQRRNIWIKLFIGYENVSIIRRIHVYVKPVSYNLCLKPCRYGWLDILAPQLWQVGSVDFDFSSLMISKREFLLEIKSSNFLSLYYLNKKTSRL